MIIHIQICPKLDNKPNNLQDFSNSKNTFSPFLIFIFISIIVRSKKRDEFQWKQASRKW